MTTVSNVSTTEYAYTPSSTSVKEAPKNVSVFNASNNQNTNSVEENNTSNYSETKKKLVELAQKYNIDLKSVFNCEIENVSDNDCKRLFEALNAAIVKLQDKNGKVDVKKVGELASQYNIALLTGWSIKGFDSRQSQNRDSLETRLKKAVSAKDVEEALDKYYTEYFEKVIEKKLANAKTPEERDEIVRTEHLRQLQDFGRLLANTPQEKREIFVKAAKSLFANNRLQGIKSAFEALNMSQKTNAANNFSNEEIAELAEKKDQFGNTTNLEDIQGIAKVVHGYKDAEHSKEDWNETFKTIGEFEQAYDALKEKETNGKLSEEDKKLLQKYETYKSIISGGTIGTAENRVIPEEIKLEILKTVNTNSIKVSEDFNNDVLKQVAQYVDKHSKELSIPVETLTKTLDKATDNKYSEAVEVYTASKEATEAKTTTSSDLGFAQKETVDTTRLNELKKQVPVTDVPESFKVEKKNAAVGYTKNETSDLETKLANMNNNSKLAYITQNFYTFSYGIKTKIGTSLKQLGHQKLMEILPRISNDSFILGIYQQVGLTSEDVKKLNVSIGAKNIMLANLEKREENQPA